MAGQNIEFKVEPLEDVLIEKFQFMDKGAIRITPSNSCMPAEYREHIDRIRRMTVRPDDVWVVTYPKCGTTWTQEMVWLLVNHLNYEEASKVPLIERSPFLEFGCLFSTLGEGHEFHMDTVKITEELKSPRVVKSHLPLQLLPEQLWTVKPKIIYVTREAKDVAVSYFHHHDLLMEFAGSLDDFVDAFIKGIVQPGSIWDHILDFWKIRYEPNLLINTFEEMKQDLPGVVARTAKFLDRNLTEEQLKQLCQHLSFESMKKNPAVNMEDQLLMVRKGKPLEEGQAFIRKGQVGGWKAEISQETAAKIDKWTRECLHGTDYPISV